MSYSEENKEQTEEAYIAFGDEPVKCWKSADGALGHVEALGIRFSDSESPDLQREYFDAETYYGHAIKSGVEATLNHGYRIITGNVESDSALAGMAKMTFSHPVRSEQTDLGIVAKHVLDLSNRFEKFVYQLAEKGAFRWSSGTAPHLSGRKSSGKTWHIERWPIVEFAYCPLAADPNLPRITTVKHLATLNPDLEALAHEAGHDHPASDAMDGTDEPETTKSDKPIEGEIMSDEETTTVAGVDVILDAIKGLGESVTTIADGQKALDTRLAAVETMPAPKKAGHITAVDDEADRALKGNPYKSFGHFLMAVKETGQGQYDKRLYPLKSSDPMNEGGFSVTGAMGDAFVGSLTAAKATKAAPTGLGESSGPAGGYLVDSDRAPGILSRVYDIGELLSRVAMDPIGPNANGMTYYAEAETSRVDGSRRGGVRFYWVAENSAITSSAPTFRALELKLRKAAALVYATDEQLADTAALESYIMRILPEELRFGVEDAIINGLGTGQPLGILNANCTVSVAKETGQAATTVVTENIVKMWARLWARSQRNAVWLVNQDVQPQLWQLNLPVGTGGQMVFVPPGGLSAVPYATLFGRPVIVHESCKTLGTVGDIMLVDPMEYQMIEKGGIEAASSIHVRFTQGEQVFRFIYRVDGQPTWNAALTPANGTNTVSPFISLAERA
jgi:HK97 family phage major capsid protein